MKDVHTAALSASRVSDIPEASVQTKRDNKTGIINIPLIISHAKQTPFFSTAYIACICNNDKEENKSITVCNSVKPLTLVTVLTKLYDKRFITMYCTVERFA